MSEPTPEQLAAVGAAQTPAEYAAAASAAGLTADAEAAAAAGAHPVAAPDFAELLAQYKNDQAAQIAALEADFNARLEALRAGVPAPAVDPSVPVTANLSDGITAITAAYPNAVRADKLAAANKELAAALVPGEDGKPATVDGAQVAGVIKLLRRFTRANPQLETGLLEHAAQLAEDQLGL
jgi:hypothetical protein